MTFPSGASFLPITLEQLDRKSPVDEDLMTAIGEDLYYLLNQLAGGGSGTGVFDFKVNGNLGLLSNLLPFRRIDGAFVSAGQTLSRFGGHLEIPGVSGTLEFDVRKYRTPLTPVTGIDYQFQSSINSITKAGASGSTQSITRATPQVSTQSITFWKAAINIQSIISVNNNLWRYNLLTAPDSDWQVGDYVIFASATNAANNGIFQIVAINSDNFPSITVLNASGVAQTTAAGTANLQAFSYNLTNPANAAFVVGEKAAFASHTSALNDGSFTLYAVNSAGNNLIVKNSVGLVQGGAAGNINVLRFTYTLGATVSTDIVVGETALFAAHTSSANDGNLPVRAVSGSTLTVYNVLGVIQGGVAGTVNSNRWIYALATDPSTSFVVGERFYADGVTSTDNSGTKTVVQINRSATNNLVVWNELGVTQAGAAGTATHTKRLIKFASDQSAIYTAALSRIALRGVVDQKYVGALEFTVLEVNRGGGANFNVVIEDLTGTGLSQANPAGRVVFESRSVFSTTPKVIVVDDLQVTTTGVLDAAEKIIAAGRILMMEILSIPTGSPQNFTGYVA